MHAETLKQFGSCIELNKESKNLQELFFSSRLFLTMVQELQILLNFDFSIDGSKVREDLVSYMQKMKEEATKSNGKIKKKDQHLISVKTALTLILNYFLLEADENLEIQKDNCKKTSKDGSYTFESYEEEMEQELSEAEQSQPISKLEEERALSPFTKMNSMRAAQSERKQFKTIEPKIDDTFQSYRDSQEEEFTSLDDRTFRQRSRLFEVQKQLREVEGKYKALSALAEYGKVQEDQKRIMQLAEETIPDFKVQPFSDTVESEQRTLELKPIICYLPTKPKSKKAKDSKKHRTEVFFALPLHGVRSQFQELITQS